MSGDRSNVASLILPVVAQLLQRLERRRGAGRAEGEDAVDVGLAWIAAAIGVLGARSGRSRSTWTTLDLAAPRPVGEALAAGVEAGVADFLVDAERRS